MTRALGNTLGTKRAPAAARTSLSILQMLLADYRPRDFAVRLWDGEVWKPEPGQPERFTLVLRHPGALRALLGGPSELALGEAYLYDDFDIEGEMGALFPLADYLLVERRWSAAERLRLARSLLMLPARRRSPSGQRRAHLRGRRFALERDRQAVTYHYDRSNAFFAVFLDERMVYSCAYFASSDESLDAAQERKLDYICRKLRLRPGERLLDIGCGWGGLVLHAAERYGVEAVGITLSRPQAELAGERIGRAGLAERCRVEVADYRRLDQAESYDKIVSVGMFEHVGEAELPAYFARAGRLLRPGGVFLNHGIARPVDRPARRGKSFLQSYVFPDGELSPISATLHAAESAGFEVRDVESLREHYALTLRHWLRRLEANRDAARRAADEVTYRVWRLYMAGSAYGFEQGRLSVYQALLAKPERGRSGLPLTRTDWYGP